MPGVKVGSIDIQFGPGWEPVKANQLVQSLQQIGNAVNALANQAAAPPTPSIPVHVLATQTGLGADHTVAGLQSGQVLIAQSPTTAHFAALNFGQLAQTDPGTFAAPANGAVIAFVNGYWSAIANTLGLANPGSDALIMWDSTANGGAGGLVWALEGTGIEITTGRVSVEDTQLIHGHLQGLSANDHPQYALVVGTPQLTTPNVFTALQTFLAGLVSGGDITLSGNLEQSGVEGVEQRIQNLNDLPNEGAWRVHVEPGQLMYAAVNDDGSDAETWLSVQRIGETVDTIALQASYLTFNGFDVALADFVPHLLTPNTFTALTTFTGGIASVAAEPSEFLTNTDDIANEGAWRAHAEPGQMIQSAMNDDGSDAEHWLSVERIADVVDTVSIEASYLTFNGFDVCCGEPVPGPGAMPATLQGYLTVTVGGKTIKVPYLSS